MLRLSLRCALLIALAGLPTAQPASAQPAGVPTLEEVLAGDAALHDIAFVDGRHGWAVGDRGVILQTLDGGKSWRRVESGVACPLYSVSFVDHRVGWAAGGFHTPYTHTSHAVLLRTEDGGETWRAAPAESLPRLSRVQLIDQRNGVAVGEATPFAPSGLFETTDGGRGWKPIPTPNMNDWSAASFVAPGVGVIGGPRGASAAVVQREVRASATPDDELRAVRDMTVDARGGGWLVGDGGLLLATNDLGQTWRQPAGAVPEAAARCDWRSVATDGPRVWIAGAPGAVMLFSPDAGRSWRLQPTGVTAPLAAVTFVDANRGWAAGAFGTILATTNGGRSWRVQRSGGERASVMVIAATAEDVPLELLATLSAAEGHLTAVDVLFASDDRRWTKAEALLREAVVKCGANSTHIDWRFALGSELRGADREQVVAHLSQSSADFSEAMVSALATRIRTQRPDMILLARGKGDKLPGAEQLAEEAVRRAEQLAGERDPSGESDELSLPAHRVARIAAAWPADVRAAPRVATNDFDSLLGTSPAHWVGSSGGLIGSRYRPPPEAVTWRVLTSSAPGSGAGRNPMAGIAVARGGDSRRPASAPAAGQLAELRDIAQKRRHMQALLSSRVGDEAWRSQALNLTSGLDADSGAELLYQLAETYRSHGRLDLAADTFYLLARRYTDHELCEPALVWLLRYYASGEVAHAAGLLNDRPGATRPLANVPSGQASPLPANNEEPGALLTPEERSERAAQLGVYIEQSRPTLFSDPAIRFPIAAAERTLGRQERAQRLLVVLNKRAIAPEWRLAARTESRLPQGLVNDTSSPNSVAACYRTDTRPRLDGAIDEEFWSRSQAIAIEKALAKIAYDDEFLFLAIDCDIRNLNSHNGDYKAGPRNRDADLSDSDRITFSFDTNRDYNSAFRLTIDSKGRTADHCWGGQPWDPVWYVAAGRSGERWTAEAAIPWAMLTPSTPQQGDAWALSVERRGPGRTTQTWAGPKQADATVPQGLLRFE